MDDKTIYSIIIAVVIIIIAIILYFLFIKKTISAVPITSTSTFSSPIVTQTSISPIPLTITIYNTCNHPVQTAVNKTIYILDSQQSVNVTINYTPTSFLAFASADDTFMGYTPILPNQTLVTPPGCPSATSPPSTQTQTFKIIYVCEPYYAPLPNAYIFYVHYPSATVGPQVIYRTTVSGASVYDAVIGYTPNMSVTFFYPTNLTTSVQTVTPSPGQTIEAPCITVLPLL